MAGSWPGNLKVGWEVARLPAAGLEEDSFQAEEPVPAGELKKKHGTSVKLFRTAKRDNLPRPGGAAG